MFAVGTKVIIKSEGGCQNGSVCGDSCCNHFGVIVKNNYNNKKNCYRVQFSRERDLKTPYSRFCEFYDRDLALLCNTEEFE